MAGHLQNLNLTRGQTEPEVTHWESAAQQSSAAASDAVVVLGVLTFGLQLCLVLFFVSRCRRIDARMRDALKQPKAVGRGAALPSLHGDVSKQADYQQRSRDSSSPPTVPLVTDQYTNWNSLSAPSIPWDLVQS